ncbi:MAG TPA: cyclase family protein [Bacteroidia bacterium]|jgi:arylformamidase|nr:cyclase family protein [Bacteroidia bacterium]
MTATITHKGKTFRIDFTKPIDISLPVAKGGVKAWYVSEPVIEPVRMGDWVGEVAQGGTVNFRNITFNPHGHGTHTECVGHISKEFYSVNKSLKQFMFVAELITVLPEEINGDLVITKKCIEPFLEGKTPEALVIRTLSNSEVKTQKNYSNTNPAYIHHEAMQYIIDKGIEHLLFDTPSVDKEVDGGALLAHKAFWEYPKNTNTARTITELVYIPNTIFDGPYLLNLQVAAIENDAAPSRPVLYRVI